MVAKVKPDAAAKPPEPAWPGARRASFRTTRRRGPLSAGALFVITERQLGRLVGKSGQLVRRLEAGLSHEGITIRVAQRLAEALSLQLPNLFLVADAGQHPSQVAADEQGSASGDCPEAEVARIGALLAGSGVPVSADGIATALGIPLSRVAAGLVTLGDRLRPLGLSLSSPTIAIVPGESTLPSEAAGIVRRVARSARPLGAQEARMMLRIVNGEIGSGASFDRPSGMVLGKLAEMGAIELPGDRWANANPPRLCPAVGDSLMLDARPTCGASTSVGGPQDGRGA